MKKTILFIVGTASGAIIAIVAFNFLLARPPAAPKPAVSTPAPPPAAVSATAELQEKMALQKQELARLKSENKALLEGLSNVVAATTRSVPAVPLPTAAPDDSVEGAGRPAGFGKMIKAAMQQQVEMKIAAMKSRLHLTDEQAQVLRELLEKQFSAAGDMAAKMFDGKMSRDELAKQGKQMGNLDAELKKMLTPEQWADYKVYQVEERQQQAQMVATAEMMQLQPMLQLTPQQREQVQTILVQQAEQQLSNKAGGKAAMDWEQGFEAKREALRAVLTPEQQESYNKFSESQREMIKSLLGPGKKDGVSANVIVSP